MEIGQTFKSFDEYIGYVGVCMVSAITTDEILLTFLTTRSVKIIQKSKIEDLLKSKALVEVTLTENQAFDLVYNQHDEYLDKLLSIKG